MDQGKVTRVLKSMEEHDVPQMIVSDPVAIFYLTGKWIFPGERLLALYLNVNGNHKFVINKLFPQEGDLGVDIIYYDDIEDGVEILSKYVEKDKTMGIDKTWPSKFLIRLQELGGGSKFVNGSPIIKYQGKEFDVTPPWRRLNMADAVKEITGVDFSKIDTDEEARAAAVKQGMDADEVKEWTRGKLIAEMFEEFCEDVPGYLDGPVFVVGHPVEISPLSKRDPQDPRITRRFEGYINGWEICNGFSELNDPIDQFERFTVQQAQLESGEDDEAHPMDMDFVNALEVGLPPTGGLGVGIDRVVMLIADAPSIRDIILFPTMKPLD